ncbi:Multidrug-efflux transporter MexB [Serratia fonticola]|uniref:Multidrug-efflux transporter MexB n=1 Tax=Serratia fonticola TaxID=47917 RepID=A0A4U9UI90_SERFO|nr:Multidrug-efflux transporter MexB [Serratia fonticola]
MTSLAFIFGVLPMAISSGAGSGSQHAVGTGGDGRYDFRHRSGDFLCALSSYWYAAASLVKRSLTITIANSRRKKSSFGKPRLLC